MRIAAPALMGYAVLVHAAVQFRAGVGIDLANSCKILSLRPLPSWPCVWPIYFPVIVKYLACHGPGHRLAGRTAKRSVGCGGVGVR
jgi:hypothetical protein